MTNLFKLPESDGCLVRNNNYVYDYLSNHRDTYELINFEWTKISTTTYSSLPSGAVCLDSGSYLLPADFAGFAFLVCGACAIFMLSLIWSIFRR